METKFELENVLKFATTHNAALGKELVVFDGFDSAIIGYDFEKNRLIYSMSKFIRNIEVTFDIYDEDCWEYFATNFYRKDEKLTDITWAYDVFR